MNGLKTTESTAITRSAYETVAKRTNILKSRVTPAGPEDDDLEIDFAGSKPSLFSMKAGGAQPPIKNPLRPDIPVETSKKVSFNAMLKRNGNGSIAAGIINKKRKLNV